MNELTKFRYDVVLRLEEQPPPLRTVQWRSWRKEHMDFEELQRDDVVMVVDAASVWLTRWRETVRGRGK